jgi:hypothetical protein
VLQGVVIATRLCMWRLTLSYIDTIFPSINLSHLGTRLSKIWLESDSGDWMVNHVEYECVSTRNSITERPVVFHRLNLKLFYR